MSDDKLILNFSKGGTDSHADKHTDEEYIQWRDHYIELVRLLDFSSRNEISIEMFEVDEPKPMTEIRLYTKAKVLFYRRAVEGKSAEAQYVCAYFLYLDILNQGLKSMVDIAKAMKMMQKEEEKIADKLMKK